MVAENCPNLYVAQATNMLAIVDFTAGRTSSGWLKIGLAVRIAQDLQLMHEPKSMLGLTASEEEERRRTFWSIYLLDKLVSCGQGRPPAIADEDCHVQLPCTQDAFNSGIIPKTADTLHALLGWNTTPDGTSVVGSAFRLVVLSGSALGRCARYGLHQRDVEDALPWDSKSEFASHGSTLLLVENHLQAEMQPVDSLADRHRRADGTVDHDVTSHIVFARTLYHLAYCLLNHSFLLRLRVQKLKCRIPPNFLTQASEVCLKHARELIELLRSATAAGLHVQSSFYAYSIAVAGSLLSLGANEARLAHLEPDGKIVAAYQLSLSMLQKIGQIWEHASKMVSFVEP
ncbi:hypothetical protein Sste5346_010382 [Sporothrix stenoceras]|uniref:Xylanolytic transcriptional activator regulatory domain-containing protein n=1 Tax=Sporothrix stenoceras TaxID=5173 RepID=A0ABR3YHE5_9PEZI